MDHLKELILTLAHIGHHHPAPPDIRLVEPFQNYLFPNSLLDTENLDKYDGGLTRREALLRYLLLDS